MTLLSHFTRKSTPISAPDTSFPVSSSKSSSSSISSKTGSPMLTIKTHHHPLDSPHSLPSLDSLHLEFRQLQKFDSFLHNYSQFSKRTLNRYSNVLCNEWSRIRLSDKVDNQKVEHYRTVALAQFQDFLQDWDSKKIIPREVIPQLGEENGELEILHANVIRGRDLNAFMEEYHVDTDFIVGHAPMREELPAFVNCLMRMEVPLVAVLAKTVENGRQKMHQWWPNETNRVMACDSQGEIRIELLAEIQHEAFMERKMRCFMGNKAHNFTMIHYENWPDFGIPPVNDFVVMADFINSVLDQRPKEQRKLYVHCSAGIGRTSTLVSSLILHEQAHNHLQKQTDSSSRVTFNIYLPLIIQILKYHRPGMTQTSAQYRYSFEFILREIQEKYPNVILKHEGLSEGLMM